MRSKADRIQKHEKILARRLRELRTFNAGVAHIRCLLNDGVIGRCGHKRCICHYIEKNRYQEQKYKYLEDAA